VSRRIEGVLPFWLDRPDLEALDIATAVHDAGLGTLWIGEMTTFDAFALATAVGLRAPGIGLKIGPIAIDVRSPVSIALGVSSVAELTGAEVAVALGASSPAIVSGWHDRDWAHRAARTRETVAGLRTIFAGERSDFNGDYVHSHGFRLRRPRPGMQIAVAAFGAAMTRVAARHADEVVMNLVPPDRVRAMRSTIDAEAEAAGRPRPRLAVWVPVALDPGDATFAQLAAQLAVYLSPPGYGDMFSELGYAALVQRARSGARRSELAPAIPAQLLAHVCALGTRGEVTARVAEYHDAGADIVGIVPSTAEDPGGRRSLTALGGATG
jgi:probable F420-dependent oxidoreductase